MDNLLDTAPCGFLSSNDDGTIVLVNRSLAERLGYSPIALHGKHIETILPLASRIFYQTHLFPLLKLHGKVEEIYLLLRSQDGELVPMLASAARQLRNDTYFNDCVFHSIQKRAQFEEEILKARQIAEEANRLKDEFLATVSHELRTPLTGIMGWLDILRLRQNDPAKLAVAIEVIQQNVRVQTQLIDDLLDASQIVSGKLRLYIQTVDLKRVIESAIASVRPVLDDQGLTLITPDWEAVGTIEGDGLRIQQIVWNLLSNAIKFTPPHGTIELGVAHTSESVSITIRDSGTGIPPDFLPHVFERFRQADQSMRRQYGGLGLGLAIVRYLVEAHGGTIVAESPGAGQGATFIVTLPRVPKVALAEPSPIPLTDAFSF